MELKSLIARSTDILGSLELDGAMDSIAQQLTDVSDMLLAIDAGAFFALPGSSGVDAAQSVAAASRTLHATLAQLITAAGQANEEYCVSSSGELNGTLRTLTSNLRSVAADLVEPEDQRQIVVALRAVLDKTAKLLNELKSAVRLSDSQKQGRVTVLAGAISNDVFAIVSLLPGQRDVEAAIQRIISARKSIQPPASGVIKPRHFDDAVRIGLESDSKTFLACCNAVVVTAQTSPAAFKSAILDLVHTYHNFTSRVLTLAFGLEESLQRPLSSAADRLTSSTTNLLLSCLSFLCFAS